jgi:hypothetical protein
MLYILLLLSAPVFQSETSKYAYSPYHEAIYPEFDITVTSKDFPTINAYSTKELSSPAESFPSTTLHA